MVNLKHVIIFLSLFTKFTIQLFRKQKHERPSTRGASVRGTNRRRWRFCPGAIVL